MTQQLIDAAKAVFACDPMSLDQKLALLRLQDVVNGIDPATPEELDRARAMYANNEIEIDEGALTSRSEEGLWVQGWVWLPAPESEYDKGVINEYVCPDCGKEWEDEWDCACNDTCPACGAREIEPTRSRDAE